MAGCSGAFYLRALSEVAVAPWAFAKPGARSSNPRKVPLTDRTLGMPSPGLGTQMTGACCHCPLSERTELLGWRRGWWWLTQLLMSDMFWSRKHTQCTLTCILLVPDSFFFFLRFFWRISFLKSLLILLQRCFCSVFWYFVHEACGIVAPWLGLNPHPLIGRWSLDRWTTKEVSGSFSCVHSPYTWQEGDVTWQKSRPHLKCHPEQWQEYKAHPHKLCQQSYLSLFAWHGFSISPFK